MIRTQLATWVADLPIACALPSRVICVVHAVRHDVDGLHPMHHAIHVGHDMYAVCLMHRDGPLTDLQLYVMDCNTCCSFRISSNSKAV